MMVVRWSPLVIGPATTIGGVATESTTPPRARHRSSLPHGGSKETSATEFQNLVGSRGVPLILLPPLPFGLVRPLLLCTTTLTEPLLGLPEAGKLLWNCFKAFQQISNIS